MYENQSGYREAVATRVIDGAWRGNGYTETPLYPASALEAARREALEVAIRLVSTVAYNCRLEMIVERYGEEATGYAADLLTNCAQRLTALKENPNAG